MKKITTERAIEKLKTLTVEGVIALDTLHYAMKSGSDVMCYGDENALIIIDNSEQGRFASVIPFSENVDVQSITDIIESDCDDAVVLFDVQRLSEQCVQTVIQAWDNKYIRERVITDLAMLNETQNVEQKYVVRLLNETDGEQFAEITNETIENRPPLKILFDVFICKGQGNILGAFDGEFMIGYLSYVQLLDGVYDVDYIYVAPKMRNKGVAKMLAQAYADKVSSLQAVPYWSNAKNEASIQTALSSGFNLVRRTIKFVPGDNTNRNKKDE